MLTRCGFNQRVRQLIGFMFLKFEHFSIHIGEVINPCRLVKNRILSILYE